MHPTCTDATERIWPGHCLLSWFISRRLTRLRHGLIVLLLSCLPLAAQAAGFDQQHTAWAELLAKHVRWTADGKASRVDYRGYARDRAQLDTYLKTLSAVSPDEFVAWSRAQQLAFLINAYNAYTVSKVLQRYPDLKSIRDFGRFIGNPWKDKFFTLLGEPRSLDDIEHGMLRAPGRYNEPRIHVAVVCASIGCPALRPEPYTAEQLEQQLEDSMRRFLSDRSRNRYNAPAQTVELSRIFDWYHADFEQGHQGFSSVQDVIAKYADLLADQPADRHLLREKRALVRFIDYDWALNDAR